MAEQEARRSATRAWLLPLFLLLGVASGILFLLPGIPERQAAGGGGGPVSSSALFPGPRPLAQSTQTTNNLRIGDVFRLTVHARPQVGIWVVASTQRGPTAIGPWMTDLGPDWWILQDYTWTGGGGELSLSIPIPYVQSWVGTEAIVQSLVHDPVSQEWAWTNSALHRFSDAPQGGRSVLLVRQVSQLQGAPFAPIQADVLANVLGASGHRVQVVDDALPQDLASFDVVMDCRFTLPPAPVERTLLTMFLQRYGGVFLLCGPTVGSGLGQWRSAFIQDWLNAGLGLGLTVGSGLNQSTGMTGEHVSPASEPRYLQIPTAIAGAPYTVEDEGGSFGPEGYQTQGWPWIVGPAPANTVYGMLFKPSDIPGLPAKGGVAVLFNGSADALGPGPANPQADRIFDNLAFWLDS